MTPPLPHVLLLSIPGLRAEDLPRMPALAALAGAAAGAAVMLTRNLGLSHAAEEAGRVKSEGQPQDKARE